jgi:prepilin-type processing-associated H-X9-DG protein
MKPCGSPILAIRRTPTDSSSSGVTNSSLGFTGVDAVVMTAAIAILTSVLIPTIATTRSQSLRVGCYNSLRQVGLGFRAWATDHEDRFPPLVSQSEGGTGLTIFGPNAWLHFSAVSNELRTPRVLLCPADATAREARNFSDLPSGGFLHVDYRDKALSYFLTHPGLDYPNDLLAGDRDFRADAAAGCSAFGSAYSLGSPPVSLAWTNVLHSDGGNALLADGRVEQFSNSRAVSFFREYLPTTSGIHFVRPR